MSLRPELNFHCPIFSVALPALSAAEVCLRGECSSRLRPRMMFLIHTLQPVERNVRVNLRGRNVGVPENSLHGAQIRSVLDHVRGATVPQHVRAGVTPALRRRFDHLPHSLPRDLLGPACDE